LIKVSGKEARAVQDPARIRPEGSEVQRLLCDNSRAKEWCGWEPDYTLEQGLQITSDWVAENLESFRPKGYQV
jgi:nucleoside-diphosphate-sugar epimerase